MGAFWNFIKPVAQQALGSIMGIGAGSIMANQNDQRQLAQQEKLSRLSLQMDKQRMDYQNEKQMEMWENTSYPKQLEMMKKAGLSPALMYGGGGAGGTTIGGGMPSGGTASAPSGGGEIMGMLQLRSQEAQIELLKAQTTKTLAEAENESGGVRDNLLADKELKQFDSIIKKYTGKDLEDIYNKVKAPNRNIEAKTYQGELEARQGVAETLYDLWQTGKLEEKSIAEVEAVVLGNSKTREETRNINKTFDILEESLKGAKLDNILKDVETQWATGTGLKGGDVKDIAVRIIGALLGMKIGKKPSGGITINNLPKK